MVLNDLRICKQRQDLSHWYKLYLDYNFDGSFLIVPVVSPTAGLCVVTCTNNDGDYLWKEEDGHIVSIKNEFVFGIPNVDDATVQLILCKKEETKNMFTFQADCKFKHK